MKLTIEEMAALPADAVRAFLPEWIVGHVEATPEIRTRLLSQLRERVSAGTDAEMAAMLAAFLAAGSAYTFYRASPFARDVTRIMMGQLVAPVELEGRAHLDRFLTTGPQRRLIVCNHLSYTDTQVTDCALVHLGYGALAERLVAIAGPKVYTEPWRRMAAIALNTRKTAQSSAVATEQDTLSARELATVAFDTIADCARLMDEGWVILLYPEGTRSRTGRLQPFLRAAARYTTLPGTQILPLAQTGTERIYPIDDTRMHSHAVRLAFAEPFTGADHPGKTGSLVEAHRRLAGALPEGYRPGAEAAALG